MGRNAAFLPSLQLVLCRHQITSSYRPPGLSTVIWIWIAVRSTPFGGTVRLLPLATLWRRDRATISASGVTSKAANGGQFKTGQREWPGTRLFYSVAS